MIQLDKGKGLTSQAQLVNALFEATTFYRLYSLDSLIH